MTTRYNGAGFSQQNLDVLRAIVDRRCPGHMNQDDRDDLAADLLLEAIEAERRTGIPLTKLVFTAAKRTNCYMRAGVRAKRMQQSLILDGDDKQGGHDPHLDGLPFVDLVDVSLLLATLTDPERIGLLHDLAGFTLNETAGVLGMSVTSTQRMIARAQVRLRMAA